MNILVVGGTGFIASQIITDLTLMNHQVICAARNTAYAKRLFPDIQTIACDFVKDISMETWLPRLKNIDVVINCVGIFYHPNKKTMWAIHHDTPCALFDAAVAAGVKKIIHLSALGVDKVAVPYATSKKSADDYLMSLTIPAIILRPSLVYGRGSYGGTSLFRGLCGLPGLLPIPGRGEQLFQPIFLEDLSQAVCHLVDAPLNESKLYPAVSSKKINLKEILTTLRQWLGFKAAWMLFVPLSFLRLGALLGNLFSNSMLNDTAYKMLSQHNIATEEETKRFHEAIGFIPKDFQNGVYRYPSTVQDHWHARLFFLKPLVQYAIAFVWLMSAITSLFLYPIDQSYVLLASVGILGMWQPIILYGAAILDALIGLAVLLNYQVKKIAVLQIVLILAYTLIITWKLPEFWLHPFAPIAKNIPFLVLILIYLALESDR